MGTPLGDCAWCGSGVARVTLFHDADRAGQVSPVSGRAVTVCLGCFTAFDYAGCPSLLDVAVDVVASGGDVREGLRELAAVAVENASALEDGDTWMLIAASERANATLLAGVVTWLDSVCDETVEVFTVMVQAGHGLKGGALLSAAVMSNCHVGCEVSGV